MYLALYLLQADLIYFAYICVMSLYFLRRLTYEFATIDINGLSCPFVPGTSLYNNLCRIMAKSLNAVVVSVE